MRGQRGNGVQQTDAVAVFLAQTQDPTGADVDAGITYVRQRLEPLVVRPRGDHVRVELARGVQVVVVGREPGLFQVLGLVLIDHAQRHADLHVHLADARDHRLDVLQTGLPTPHVPPGGTHAEPSAAVGFGVAGFLQHVLDGRHLGGLEAGVVARGLRTVGAVLAAPAGLDVHQGAHLDGGGVVEAAVDSGLSISVSNTALLIDQRKHQSIPQHRSIGSTASRRPA